MLGAQCPIGRCDYIATGQYREEVVAALRGHVREAHDSELDETAVDVRPIEDEALINACPAPPRGL